MLFIKIKARRKSNPNICAIYEFGEHEGKPFIVMQLLEGQTLREYLGAVTAKHELLPLERLLEIATHIADREDRALPAGDRERRKVLSED